jgi:type I restriction enzyme S subunit
LRPARGIDPKFIYYTAASSEFVNSISGQQYGVSYPAVKDEQVRARKLLLPPSNEQRSIVAKIEELFSELDKGIDSLQTAQEQLNAYRQSILKHAFMGKLTAPWREENKEKLETAAQLHVRLKDALEQYCQRQIAEWKSAVQQWKLSRQTDSAPSPPKPHKLLCEPLDQSAGPGILPDGWNWVPLSWMLSISKKPMTTGPFGTMLKKQEHQAVGVPVLGIENIGRARFLSGNKIFVSQAKSQELKSFEVEPGDLVISRSGTVGEICQIPSGLGTALISTNLMRISLNPECVLPAFFVYMFQGGGSVRTQVKDLCKGSSREFLNQSILDSIIYPLCSVSEQQELLEQIDQQLTRADAMQKEIELAFASADALRQSILKRAFSGRLVAQNPNDESASILLGRIKSEKVADSNGKKKSNNKKEAA